MRRHQSSDKGAKRFAGAAGHPVAGDAQFRLARRYFDMKVYKRSAAEFQRFSVDFTGHKQLGAAQFLLGESHFQLKKYDLAVQAFGRMIENFPEGSPSRETLQKRFDDPTLWDSFLRFLAGRDYPVPEALLARDVTGPVEPSPEVQRVLVDVYRNDPAVASFCERLIDFDEGLQEWRYRHVKMVERTIGTRQGTGGSTGAEYLRTTLLRPIFPDLWTIRTEF